MVNNIRKKKNPLFVIFDQKFKSKQVKLVKEEIIDISSSTKLKSLQNFNDIIAVIDEIKDKFVIRKK